MVKSARRLFCFSLPRKRRRMGKTEIPSEKTDKSKWKQYGQSLKQIMTALLYPPDIYCLACGKPIDPGHLYSLCEECLNEIIWANRKNCRICGKPLEDWYPEECCSECLSGVRYFERGVTCFLYKGGVRNMIRDLKYHGKMHIARVLGQILADKILYEDLSFDLGIPVPMNEKKEKQRGYNQAELIGRFACRCLNKPFLKDGLLRTRWTIPMNTLTAQERRNNLKGAFQVPEKHREAIRGRTILLIDDIYTTGSTMNECTRALLEGGAARVRIASAASGRNQRELAEEHTKVS